MRRRCPTKGIHKGRLAAQQPLTSAASPFAQRRLVAGLHGTNRHAALRSLHNGNDVKGPNDGIS